MFNNIIEKLYRVSSYKKRKIMLSNAPTAIAVNNMINTIINVVLIPISFIKVKNVAMQGRYSTMNTEAIISCLISKLNGMSKAIETSFLKNPKIITEIVSFGSPKILVIG